MGGVNIDKRKDPGTALAFELAALYALAKGALVVTHSFNDSADLDNNGDIVRYPCEAFGVICVSATGPTGADGSGNWVEVDARATDDFGVAYSGFGAAVDAAAPGGSGPAVQTNPLLSRRVWLPCLTTPTDSTVPPACRNTATPIERRMVQGLGPSWSALHVSGLAALLVAQLGHNRPLLIRERILQTADDLGDPGKDPYYGMGRINVARALGLIN